MELLKNTIPRYRTCGIRSEAFTESGDAIVSDVNPDVMNIVNTEANLVIREKTLLAGSGKVTGEIQAQIYYQAYENEERSHLPIFVIWNAESRILPWRKSRCSPSRRIC